MKSSHRPLKPIKKSLNPVGMLLIAGVLISCMLVIGCTQVEDMGGPQELAVEVSSLEGVRASRSEGETDPSDIAMSAAFYCLSVDDRIVRLRDEEGNDVEVELSYDEESACWRGTTSLLPCENLYILAGDREGEGGPLYCYGMAQLNFSGTQRVPIEGRPVYSLGEEGPAGGYIYYEQTGTDFLVSGWRYLESAPNGWGEGEIPTSKWGWYDEFAGTASALDDVGLGEEFTALLCLSDETGIAATVCDEAAIGGKDDWFLPSGSELELLFGRLREQSTGTSLEGLAEGYYWSSTEVDKTSAIQVLFSTSEEPTRTSQQKNSLGIRCLPSRRF